MRVAAFNGIHRYRIVGEIGDVGHGGLLGGGLNGVQVDHLTAVIDHSNDSVGRLETVEVTFLFHHAPAAGKIRVNRRRVRRLLPLAY